MEWVSGIEASSSTITWSFITLLNTQTHRHQQSHDPFWHYSTHRRIVINNHVILCHTTQHTDTVSSTITWSFLTLLDTQMHRHQQPHDPLSHYSTHRCIVINNHMILCHTTQHTDASSSTITWSFITLLNTQMHRHQQSRDPLSHYSTHRRIVINNHMILYHTTQHTDASSSTITWSFLTLLDTQTHRHQQSHDPLSHYSTHRCIIINNHMILSDYWTHRRIIINNHMILCHTTQHTDALSSTITWSSVTLLNTQTHHHQQSRDPLSHYSTHRCIIINNHMILSDYSTHRRIVINNHMILCHTTQHTDASSSTITWSSVTLLNTQTHHHQQSRDPFSHYSTHKHPITFMWPLLLTVLEAIRKLSYLKLHSPHSTIF